MSDPRIQANSTQLLPDPRQSRQDTAAQAKLVVKLFFSTLAIAALFLPWITLFGASLSGWSMQIGPLLTVSLVLVVGLSVHGYMQGELAVSPMIRASVWGASFAISIGYALYWVSFAVLRCFGVAFVAFALVAGGLFAAEMRECHLGDRRFPQAIAALSLALSITIGLASGRTVSSEMEGIRATPTMGEALRGSMAKVFGSARGSSIAPFAPSAQPTNSSFLAPSMPSSGTSLPPRMEIRCVQWSESQQLGSGDLYTFRPDPGKKFVVVKVSVTSRESGQVYVSADDFRATCDNRNVYNARTFIANPGLDLISAELLPGGSTTGDVVFEVDQSAKPVSVEYSKGLL